VRCVETEQERDDQQPQQATDTAAVLQDELIRAADRERQLQRRLDKVKDDASRLRRQLEQQSKEFDDFRRNTACRWEQEMKQRSSTFIWFHFIHSFIHLFTHKTVT